MTSASLSRRLAVLATLSATLMLAACGSGSSGSGSSTVRALNLTSDLPSLDLYINAAKQFSSQNTNTLSGNVSLDAGSYAVGVNSAGSSTSLVLGTSGTSVTYTFSKDAHYTAVVWGSQANLRVSTIPEDEDTTQITAGSSRIRMFNATTETGPVDVYLTAPAADLTAVAPTQGSVLSGGLTGFKELPAGTYRLRVTGVGRPDDIRLDVPSITLNATQYSTLVLTAGPGGVLVNGAQIVQQGATTILSNPSARVRVIASVDSSGAVAVTTGNTVLTGGLVSNNSSYALVPAGAQTTSVRINGNPLLTGTQTFAAGGDYTLLVYGPPASAQLSVITDDNRLPLSTTRTKIRVINGVASLDALNLSVDNGSVTNSAAVLPGTAAAYGQVTSNTASQIEVDSPTLGPIYVTTRSLGDNLGAQGVYSVLVYSGKSGVASKLINERP